MIKIYRHSANQILYINSCHKKQFFLAQTSISMNVGSHAKGKGTNMDKNNVVLKYNQVNGSRIMIDGNWNF